MGALAATPGARQRPRNEYRQARLLVLRRDRLRVRRRAVPVDGRDHGRADPSHPGQRQEVRLMTRAETITQLLVRYHELGLPQTGGIPDKNDSRTLLRPHERLCPWHT